MLFRSVTVCMYMWCVCETVGVYVYVVCVCVCVCVCGISEQVWVFGGTSIQVGRLAGPKPLRQRACSRHGKKGSVTSGQEVVGR